MGGTPHFWMARLDIGRAEPRYSKILELRQSIYKHFEHGLLLRWQWHWRGTGSLS